MQQFGSGGGMDLHAAREELRRERDRNMRILQDDDRRRGILGNTAIARREGASALLAIPIADAENENKKSGGSGGGAATTPRSGTNQTPRGSYRPPQFVSGAAQLIAPRDSSPSDINHSDTVLCVITLVSAVNPSHCWTMPATTHLWNELEAKAFVPYCNPPVEIRRTVVATSTHTHRTLNLMSEYVRDVMLTQTECVTCVMAGETVPSDRTFWTTWDPAVPVDPDEIEAANLAAAEGEYEPHLPISTQSFPGELLQPAPGLVGRSWPSEQGKLPGHLADRNRRGQQQHDPFNHDDF
jgi:hypothetical protein